MPCHTSLHRITPPRTQHQQLLPHIVPHPSAANHSNCNPCTPFPVPCLPEVYDTFFPPTNQLSGPHAARAWHPMGPENTLVLQPANSTATTPPGSTQPTLPKHWPPLPEPAGKLNHSFFQDLFVPTTVAGLRAAAGALNDTKAVYVDKIPFLVDVQSMPEMRGSMRVVLEHVRFRCRAVPVVSKLKPYLGGAQPGLEGLV